MSDAFIASETSYTGHSIGSSDVSYAFVEVCVKSSDPSCVKNVYESCIVVSVVGSDELVVVVPIGSSDSYGLSGVMSIVVCVVRWREI